MRHRILLAGAFLYLLAANIIWIARDTRPPFWDMAAHQSAALRIYDAFSASGLAAIGLVPQLTGFYPPLFHSIVAAFYGFFGLSIDSAQWANIPAILLLLIATYGLGRTVLPELPAAAAAMTVSFYPILLWLSRETIIDYWLTSMVALAMWLLVLTEEFSNRARSVAFGAVCGLGMLTKWTFPFFLGLPFLWFARRNPRNAATGAGVGALIAAYWYVFAGPRISEFMKINSAGAVAEGDPTRWSLQAVLFYIRALEGYQVFLPLFALFLAGAFLVAKDFDRRWTPLILWIAGGWFALMFFQNKDPRSSAPLLPAVALISAQVFQKKQVLIALLIPFLLFQHYLVSFGIKRLPETVVIAKGVEGPLSWDWNLYTQVYFDLWGPPAREDWRIRHVLENVSPKSNETVRIGMVPDIPRFDSHAFEFYARLMRLPIVINRLAVLDHNAIVDNDFILLSERGQGFAEHYSANLKAINEYIFSHPESFRVADSFPLPNGEVIRLYKVGSS